MPPRQRLVAGLLRRFLRRLLLNACCRRRSSREADDREQALRATMVSGTVDMPTASAPRVRAARISAGVSKLGPAEPDVDAGRQGDAARVAAARALRAARIVGVDHVDEAADCHSRRTAGSTGEVDVVGDRHQRAGGMSRRRLPAALVSSSVSQPSAARASIGSASVGLAGFVVVRAPGSTRPAACRPASPVFRRGRVRGLRKSLQLP